MSINIITNTKDAIYVMSDVCVNANFLEIFKRLFGAKK